MGLNVLAPVHDTIRVLVDWKCNLSCSYCCNEIPEFRVVSPCSSLRA